MTTILTNYHCDELPLIGAEHIRSNACENVKNNSVKTSIEFVSDYIIMNNDLTRLTRNKLLL